MAIHYARHPGIPACGHAVVETERTKTSRWKSEPVTYIDRQVTEAVETSRARASVDCEDCIPLMDADGIP
jgi:hypothetical protein